MKNAKICFLICTLAFLSIVATGCGKKEEKVVVAPEAEYVEYPGDVEYSLEEERENLSITVKNLVNSMNSLKEDMTDNEVTSEGLEKGQEVIDKYEERVIELSEMSFEDSSMEEIESISSEITEIMTKIREARDLISGI